MKKFFLSLLVFAIFARTAFSQNNFENLLVAGIQDAKTFTYDYLKPATEGAAFAINNGWYNNAKEPHRFAVEVSIIGNTTFIKDKHKSFQMNISDYENIRFPNNGPSMNVSTFLGENNPEVTVIATYDGPIFNNREVEITLPNGIASENVNLIPTTFLQLGFSPFKGTQLKARFFPKINTQDVEVGLYGVGLQQEFTGLFPKIIPVAVSGLVAYTHLDGGYDLTNTSIIEGENQKVENDMNTLLFQLILGTRLKIINFYGGLGYITGKSTTHVLGTYRATDGIFFSEEVTDPFSVKHNVSGLRGTIGVNLKLGFFGLNLDYCIAEFDSASLGLNFSF